MFDKIYSVLESIGMTPEELVLKWVENGKIDLDRIAALAKQNMQNKSPEIQKIKQVEAGMFLTSQKTICREFDADTCEAVILNVDQAQKKALMFSIKGAVLAFSSDGLSVDSQGFSGLNSTHFINQMASDQKITAEAANYCLEFENSLVQKGNAFLPSLEELTLSTEDVEKVYQAFTAAKLISKTFWTSTAVESKEETSEENKSKAYIFDLRSSKISFHEENERLPMDVHPVYFVNLKQIL